MTIYLRYLYIESLDCAIDDFLATAASRGLISRPQPVVAAPVAGMKNGLEVKYFFGGEHIFQPTVTFHSCSGQTAWRKATAAEKPRTLSPATEGKPGFGLDKKCFIEEKIVDFDCALRTGKASIPA